MRSAGSVGATLAMIATVGGAARAAAQAPAAPRRATTPVSAPGVPSTLVTDLRDRVRAAAERTGQYIEVARAAGVGRAATWRTVACQVRDVAIEFHPGAVPQSAVAATVAGRTRSRVRGGFATRDAAARGEARPGRPPETITDARFALLYVRRAGAWHLALAKARPEPGPAAGAPPRDAADGWRELWTGAPSPHQQDACLTPAVWRRLGPE